MGSIFVTDPATTGGVREVKLVSGIDDPRYCVISVVVERATSRAVWRTVEQAEIATLEYVDWFNHRRLFEACGDISPAELETAHYRHYAALTEAGHSNP